jgi:hypothetical protein
VIRWFKRMRLEAEIAGWEADLSTIAEQRKNDDAAEEVITHQLARARRRLQGQIQDDVNRATAANVRRMKFK